MSSYPISNVKKKKNLLRPCCKLAVRSPRAVPSWLVSSQLICLISYSCAIISQLPFCKWTFRKTLQLKLVPVCSDFTASLLQFAAGELVASSQSLRNCFAASWHPPHLHISFANEILFVAMSLPWPCSDLASIFATPSFLHGIHWTTFQRHTIIWCLLVLWWFHLAVPDPEMTCRDLTSV